MAEDEDVYEDNEKLPFEVYTLIGGRVLALHSFECRNCDAVGVGYFDMSCVVHDKVCEARCIQCQASEVYITTFKFSEGM